MPISQDLVLGFWCPSLEIRMAKGLACGAFGADHERIATMFKSLQAGEPISRWPGARGFLNQLQVMSSSRFLYGPTSDFALAEKMLNEDPELRDVQSLMTVGGMGKAPPPKRDMPEGFCVVFYGRLDHHLIKVTRWDREAVGLGFETSDLRRLQEVINDQPVERTRLYKDGYEIMGTNGARLEISVTTDSAYVRVLHEDEGLREIEKVITAMRDKKND